NPVGRGILNPDIYLISFPKEPGRSLRAELRARATAPGDSAGLADVLGLPGRSNPATLLQALSPVVARTRDEGQPLGDAPQRLPRTHFSFDGKLVPPHRFSVPIATRMKPILRIAGRCVLSPTRAVPRRHACGGNHLHQADAGLSC